MSVPNWANQHFDDVIKDIDAGKGMTKSDLETKYRKERASLEGKLKSMRASASNNKTSIVIENEIISVVTKLKSGDRVTRAFVDKYFGNRFRFSLPERRLVRRAIETVDPSLALLYDNIAVAEEILEVIP